MKKHLTLLFLIVTICLTSKATTYYIAASGNDANNGTSTSTPWKTLTKLNSFFSSLKPGDNVYLNRGDVFYGTITINKSGSSGSPITISAYGSGADPVVTGFTSVSSWTNLGSNIWQSTSAVSSLSVCTMVVINGVNTAMGRYPNSGYLTYVSASGNTSITCPTIGATNWAGAEAVIKKNDYTLDRCVITNQSGSIITYTDSYGTDAATAGYGFFIENDVRTLDQQNEWFYNTSTKKIEVYSTATPANVQVATVSNLLYNNGFDYITIDNVTFSGSTSNAIYFNNSNTNNCNIQNCTVSFAGNNGIYIVTGNNCNINNNVLNDCNSTGIESDAGTGNSITNNSLTNMGILIGQSVIHNTGIYAASQNVVIKYNSVQNTGYTGISLNPVVVTGLVQYNFVNSTGLVLDDGGGIYTSSPSQGGIRTIDHNIVINTFGSRDGTSNTTRSLSAGIYCDDLSSNIVITNNSVYASVNVGIKMHRANNCTVSNNTCYNNSRYQVYYQNNSSTSDVYKITSKNNIYFSKTYSSNTQDQWVFGIYSQVNDLANFFGVSDSNYYCRPINDNNTFDTYQPSTGYVNRTLATWQSFTGQDLHSKISPKAITDTNNLIFEYNASSSSKTINLGAAYIDARNVSYNGSITLAPYSSAVLIKTGAATNQPPIANAGVAQVITLPVSTVTLTGSGTDANGTITAYGWSKISGPSSGTITSASSATTTVTSLVQGTYQFQLTVTDNNGAMGLDTVQVTVNAAGLLPAVTLSSPVNGLNYQYYQGNFTAVPAFSTLTPVKTGTSSTFDISVATQPTAFAINFTGYINVPSDGQYTFYTNSDDGSNLYIDNVLVVNNDGVHAATEESGTIGLKAGYHSISVGYFQQAGGSSLTVSYAGPGISEQTIPSSAFYITSTNGLLPAVNPANTVNGLNYSYYQATAYTAIPAFSTLTPVSTGTTTNFNISVAARQYTYALNFTGYINVPSDGQYTFYTNSDDGSNLYIDNVLVVNNDYVHPAMEISGTIGLMAGKHSISVGYFQELGGSVLTVSYTGPAISKQAIPASALYIVSTTGSNTLAFDNSVNQTIASSSQFSLQAYPNPFLNSINVNIAGDAGTYKLILVDVSGKILWTATGTKSAGILEQSINTAAMQRGIYFLKVIQNNNSSVIKVVK